MKGDLTAVNASLLCQIRKHKKVVNCWTPDGCVFAIAEETDKTDAKVEINCSRFIKTMKCIDLMKCCIQVK